MAGLNAYFFPISDYYNKILGIMLSNFQEIYRTLWLKTFLHNDFAFASLMLTVINKHKKHCVSEQTFQDSPMSASTTLAL